MASDEANDARAYVAILLNTSAVVWILYFIIQAMVNRSHLSIHNNSSIVTLSIMTMTLFLITSLMTATGYVLNITIDQNLLSEPNIVPIFAALFWRCAQMMAYSLFIARFKQSFENTKYATSRWMYCSLYIGTIMFILVYIAYMIFCHVFKIKIFLQFYGWIINAILSSILQLLVSISILTLFTKRLWSLTFDLAIKGRNHLNHLIVYHHSEEHSHSTSKSLILNDYQLNVVDAMSKILVLSLCCILSFQVSMVIEIVCSVLFKDDAYWGYDQKP